jgi:hypothetical protein
MPARDRYHDRVKNALIEDGWTITADPLHVKWGKKDLYVDLGAEQRLAAENLFEEPIGELMLKGRRLQLIVFDPLTETIRQWVPQNPIAG